MSLFSDKGEKAIAAALSDLTSVLRDTLEFRRQELVTKSDLAAAEARITEAFGERVDPEALKALGKGLEERTARAKEALENAPTISG